MYALTHGKLPIIRAPYRLLAENMPTIIWLHFVSIVLEEELRYHAIYYIVAQSISTLFYGFEEAFAYIHCQSK